MSRNSTGATPRAARRQHGGRGSLMAVGAVAMALAVVATLMWTPSTAVAQENDSVRDFPSWQLQRFRPAAGPADYLTVFGTGVAPHLQWSAGAYFNHADHPVFLSGAQGVAYQTQLDVAGTIGLYDIAEVSLVVPWTMRQRGAELGPLWPDDESPPPHLPQTALNDLRLTSKFEVLPLAEHPFGLSFVAGTSIPLGNSGALGGDGGFVAEALAIGEYVFYETIRASANLGFRYRPGERHVQENVLGNEVTWGLGVHSPFITDDLDVIGELTGAVGVQPRPERLAGIVEGEVPVEGRAALRYGFHDRWSVTGGIGAGMTDGVGAPNWRVFFGIDGKWATGGWWRVDYSNPNFEVQVDPCEGWEPGEYVRRLRFDPEEDCATPESRDLDDPAALLDRPRDRDQWSPPEPEQPDGQTDEQPPAMAEDDEGHAAIRQGAIVITDDVTFETGSAQITAESTGVLDDVATLIERNEAIVVLRIDGHTDDVGPAQMNLDLSQQRADSVRQYLIDAGIEPERLESVGFGEEEPVADNDTSMGRAQNRRVEFHIVEMEIP